jgi:hypothetical protein
MCEQLGILDRDSVRMSIMIDRGIMVEPMRTGEKMEVANDADEALIV